MFNRLVSAARQKEIDGLFSQVHDMRDRKMAKILQEKVGNKVLGAVKSNNMNLKNNTQE